EDDGRGIDDTKIRDRLIERKILSPRQASQLTRAEAIEYIWHPGFSTAAKVTDVSGRGVGMDIVKSRIAELAGSIETESNPNVGTTFILKLPLTLAIIDSLLVNIRGIVFAIPKDDVREMVLVPESEIIDVQGKRAFEVRGEYVPLVCIDQIFQWPATDPNSASNASKVDRRFHVDGMQEVAIVQSRGRVMGVAVDCSIGSQDVVIKSLAENFISIEGLAGATILGDGSVALMLDVATMFIMAMPAAGIRQ
ncbi:MAG: chemotaxis protein CheW, partial [Planctomycetota bacterium]